PVKTWIPRRDDYCDAMLRLKGRGAWWSNGCARCGDRTPNWRCQDCFGNRMLCTACMIEKHRDEPLHLFEVSQHYMEEIHEQTEDYFHPRTTRDLGLRFQIGHPAGQDCPFVHLARPTKKKKHEVEKGFVVLHDNAIHILDVDFCGCPGSPSEADQLFNIGWYPRRRRSHRRQPR
ncbi:hypothetical protein B0H11DRAFT_1714588, partial [Mycena galericulata]